MSLHVVVGAGPVGSAVATLLADAGEDVRVVTRSGAGPVHPTVQRITADASDRSRLQQLTMGAVALYATLFEPPVKRLAAAGGVAARRRRGRRCRARHHRKPLRIRAGVRPDDGDDAADGDRAQGAGTREDVA